jgi:hypothetical protein
MCADHFRKRECEALTLMLHLVCPQEVEGKRAAARPATPALKRSDFACAARPANAGPGSGPQQAVFAVRS